MIKILTRDISLFGVVLDKFSYSYNAYNGKANRISIWTTLKGMYITVEGLWCNEIKMIGKDSLIPANDFPITIVKPDKEKRSFGDGLFANVQGFYDV